jgi:hypothetical protein
MELLSDLRQVLRRLSDLLILFAQSSRSSSHMKKPTIRVTKWLSDIPVEACCSACPAVSFRAHGSQSNSI